MICLWSVFRWLPSVCTLRFSEEKELSLGLLSKNPLVHVWRQKTRHTCNYIDLGGTKGNKILTGVLNMKLSLVVFLLKLKVRRDNPTSEMTSPNTQTSFAKDVASSCDFLTLPQNFSIWFLFYLKKIKDI